MHLHDDPDDIDYLAAMKLQRREISKAQLEKFEGYAAEIFSAFGMDINTAATIGDHVASARRGGFSGGAPPLHGDARRKEGFEIQK